MICKAVFKIILSIFVLNICVGMILKNLCLAMGQLTQFFGLEEIKTCATRTPKLSFGVLISVAYCTRGHMANFHVTLSKDTKRKRCT